MMLNTVRTLLSFTMMAFVVSCTASHVDLGDPEANLLRIRLVSDLVPVYEVATVQVALLDADDDDPNRTQGQFAERSLSVGEALHEGFEVAVFEGLDAGDYTIRVTLLRTNGEVLGRALVTITKPEGSYAVTTNVTADCINVECPFAGGSTSLVGCIAARCVDPRCTPETPEFCPPDVDLFCSEAADCIEGFECLNGGCVPIEP